MERGYQNKKGQNIAVHSRKHLMVIFLFVLVVCLAALIGLNAFGAQLSVKATPVFWNGGKTANFSGGDGSEETPYEISTGEELALLAYNINYGVAGFNSDTVYYKLVDDIYLNETTNWEDWGKESFNHSGLHQWNPIGDNLNYSFSANFDGDNHTVYGLYINATSSYQGLFGHLSHGEISNLVIEESFIRGNELTGGVVGYVSYSSITNCSNMGNVTDTSNIGSVGGIAGSVYYYSSITNCSNAGNISGDIGSGNTGGIVGNIREDSSISNSHNTGSIIGKGSNTGGVVGRVSVRSSITNCSNIGEVLCESASGNTAGIAGRVGESNGKISNSFNTGSVIGKGINTGGIAGIINDIGSNVTNCYNTGEVLGENSSGNTGGVSGSVVSRGSITNCYNMGEVSGKGSTGNTGGVSGNVSYYSSITNCYNAGNVIDTSGNDSAGGIVGWVEDDININNCYFLQEGDVNLGLNAISSNGGSGDRNMAVFDGNGLITSISGSITDLTVDMTLLNALNMCVDNNAGEEYLIWRQITFNYTGGSSIDALHCQVVFSGQKATLPTDPTKGCAGFIGWKISEDSGVTLGDKWDFDNDMVMTDVILYAVWTNPYTHVAATASTCTSAGNREYWHCSVCGKYYNNAEYTNELTQAQTIINASGHSYSHITAVAATCINAGNREYWHCSVCGNYFSDANYANGITLAQTIINASGHSYSHITAVAATCTNAGNREYWHCSVCRKYFNDANYTNEITQTQTIINSIGHNYNNSEWIKKDSDSHERECLLCSEKDTKAHSFGSGVITAPTYITAGFTTYSCIDCEYFYITGNVAMLTYKVCADDNSKVSSDFFDDYILGETLTVPMCEGYTFDGWYKDAGFSLPVTSVSAEDLDGNSNITLYAKWIADSTELSPGAIAGIVIGVVFVVSLLCFCVVWFVIKKKKFSDLFKSK